MTPEFYNVYMHNKSKQFNEAFAQFNPGSYLAQDYFYATEIVSHYIITKKDCPYRQELLDHYLNATPSQSQVSVLSFFLSFEEELRQLLKNFVMSKPAEERQEYLKKYAIKCIKNNHTYLLSFLLDCGLVFSNKVKKELKQIDINEHVRLLLDRATIQDSIKLENNYVEKNKKIMKL